MIDLSLGYRGVPGMFSPEDATTIQLAVRRATPGSAVVETGAWCGRSLAAICDVAHASLEVHSYDNYLEDSQAVGEGESVGTAAGPAEATAPITPQVAKQIRSVVAKHYFAHGVDVRAEVQEASAAGTIYKGAPISVLFIDDHHSAEQLEKNFASWLPHCANQCTVLLHDYLHLPYGLQPVAERTLPALGYAYVGWRAGSGIGIWTRGYK